MQRRLFHVHDHILHFLHHRIPLIRCMRSVYRFVHGHRGPVQGFLHLQAVKLDPAVGPGISCIRNVGGNLPGKEQKSLSCGYFEGVGQVIGARCHEGSLSLEDIVKQIVIAGGWSEDMTRFAFFAPALIHIQINVILVAEN